MERLKFENPIIKDRWFADPEARVYDDKLFIYVTQSEPFCDQHNLSLVVSEDMKTFKVFDDILDMSTFSGATFAIWAPTVEEKNGKYYLIFAANNVHPGEPLAGLYVGVCDTPYGPFVNVKKDKSPLLPHVINRAQPIDAHLFKDDDGTMYLLYGGWGHLNFCKMNESMDGLSPLDDGKYIREITPQNYVEAPCVFKENGKYYYMYSSGGWTNETYAVHFCVKDDIGSQLSDDGIILKKNDLAPGPGHNGYFKYKGNYYNVYHRRVWGDNDSNHRVLCIDDMYVTAKEIIPIVMT